MWTWKALWRFRQLMLTKNMLTKLHLLHRIIHRLKVSWKFVYHPIQISDLLQSHSNRLRLAIILWKLMCYRTCGTCGSQVCAYCYSSQSTLELNYWIWWVEGLVCLESMEWFKFSLIPDAQTPAFFFDLKNFTKSPTLQ